MTGVVIANHSSRAMEQPENARDAWLVNVCGDDAALLAELRELVGFASQNDSDGLLDAPIDNGFTEETPTTIGPYRVTRFVGAGGTGAVFEGVHQDTSRQAAVKLIRTGFNTTRQRMRFQIEAELLAKLNHAGIAQLFDAGQATVQYDDGSTSQRMFIAMEFVDGRSVRKFCDSANLTIRGRIELMEQVARAVQHAHECGVVHRDLKPANILVTKDGAAKIVDFGIGRLTGSERNLTLTGVVMGTPSYMSPEQMAGQHEKVGTRSDVYSMGAVLYELLAGNPPVEAPSALTPSAAFSMLNAEPARVMTLKPDVPRDLDAVIHKALERYPDKRYPTAREFADDLRNWMSNLPVEARQPGVIDRVKLQFRRRPRLMVGLLVGAISLATLGSFGAYQAVRATRESRVASQQRDEAVKQSTRADRQTRIAQAVSQFMRDDVLGQANSAMQAGSGLDPDPDIKISTALDLAAQNLNSQFKDEPAVEAAIRYSLGTSYNGIGKVEKALEQFKRAAEIETTLDPNSPESIDARTLHATLVADAGSEEESKKMLVVIYADAVRALGVEHKLTLLAMSNLTLQMATLGESEAAIPMMKENLARAERVFGADDAETITMRSNLAYALGNTGKIAEATEQKRQVYEARRLTRGEAHPSTILSLNNFSMGYFMLGDYPKAAELQRQGLATAKKSLGADHPHTLTLQNNLARTLDELEQYDEALALSQASYDAYVRLRGPEHPTTLWAADGLGEKMFSKGQYAEALALFKRIYPIEVRVNGQGDFATLRTSRNIVLTLMRLNRWDEALAEANKSLTVHRESLGADSGHTFLAADLVVQALVYQKKLAEAEPIARDTFERSVRVTGIKTNNTRGYGARLARILDALGKSDEAAQVRATTRPASTTTKAASTLPATRP